MIHYFFIWFTFELQVVKSFMITILPSMLPSHNNKWVKNNVNNILNTVKSFCTELRPFHGICLKI